MGKSRITDGLVSVILCLGKPVRMGYRLMRKTVLVTGYSIYAWRRRMQRYGQLLTR